MSDPRKKLKKLSKKQQPDQTAARPDKPVKDAVSSQPNEPGMPQWASLVINLFLGGVVLVVFAASWGVFLLDKWQKDSIKPEQISATLSRIADVPAGLPEGFQASSGNSLPWAYDAVNIEHAADGQQYTLMRQSANHIAAPDMLKRQMPKFVRGNNFEIKTRGSLQVAGEPMLYIVGEYSQDEVPKGEELIGIIQPKNSPDVIVLNVGNHKQINMQETKRLLDSIKGFGHDSRTNNSAADQRSHSSNNAN